MSREWLSRGAGLLGVALGLLMLVVAAYRLPGDWRPWLLVIVGLWFVWAGWRQFLPSDLPPMAIDPADPAFTEAKQRAHREIARLHAGLAEGRKEALVKFPLQTDTGEREQVWGVLHSLADATATVTLVSDPVGDPGALDARLRIPEADLLDWILGSADGALEGGFSHLAMAKQYKREKGYLPYSLRKQLAKFTDFTLSDV